MGLKGQWNTLKKWQQGRLRHYAIEKYWKKYWYYKEVFLYMDKEKY